MVLLAQDDGVLSGRLASLLERVESRFQAELYSDLDCVNHLVAHVERYRGKMLRPTLVLAAAMAARPDAEDPADEPVLLLGTVVEMVHMATLVHDDILDEAEVRRGGATINHLTGNEAAVMLGDYLISHAYHLCSALGRPEVSRAIADATNTVCEGELLQLSNRNQWALDERTYYEIVRRKTASLCGVCCRLPVMIHPPPPEVPPEAPSEVPLETDSGRLEQGLYDYGEKLGVAFQIVDDLLDLTGDETRVGKTLGRDLQKGKLTLPLIHYLAQADAPERQRMVGLLRAQTDPDLPAHSREDGLGQVHRALRDSDSVAYARDRARQLVHRAQDAARQALPESPARGLLLELARRVLDRES